MNYSNPKFDFQQAQEYFNILEPGGKFTFQTFPDNA